MMTDPDENVTVSRIAYNQIGEELGRLRQENEVLTRVNRLAVSVITRCAYLQSRYEADTALVQIGIVLREALAELEGMKNAE